jgi:hypothetical protein
VRASSKTKTGAHSRFAIGTRQPPRNSHTERGSVAPPTAYAEARLAMSQLVRTTALPTTANAASTLSATPNQVAAPATRGCSSTERLTSNSTYRIRWTNTAAPTTIAVPMRVLRTVEADGPSRSSGASVASWGPSKWSVRPQRGMTE